MSSLDTERYRTQLLDERKRVEDAIRYLHEEHAGPIEEEVEEISVASGNHLAETATATLDREIDFTLEENAEQVLAAIDAALERIASGGYGTCVRCGRAIDVERLDAMPYATLCIECKRAEERG